MQKAFGQCSADFMKKGSTAPPMATNGFCDITCGACDCQPPSPSPSPITPPATLSTPPCVCADNPPDNSYTCSQQASCLPVCLLVHSLSVKLLTCRRLFITSKVVQVAMHASCLGHRQCTHMHCYCERVDCPCNCRCPLCTRDAHLSALPLLGNAERLWSLLSQFYD